MGKYGIINGSKCGPQVVSKSCKKWSLRKVASEAGASCKSDKTRGQKNPQKTTLFRKTPKTVNLPLFLTFLSRVVFVISDRVLVGIPAEMSKLG